MTFLVNPISQLTSGSCWKPVEVLSFIVIRNIKLLLSCFFTSRTRWMIFIQWFHYVHVELTPHNCVLFSWSLPIRGDAEVNKYKHTRSTMPSFGPLLSTRKRKLKLRSHYVIFTLPYAFDWNPYLAFVRKCAIFRVPGIATYAT